MELSSYVAYHLKLGTWHHLATLTCTCVLTAKWAIISNLYGTLIIISKLQKRSSKEKLCKEVVPTLCDVISVHILWVSPPTSWHMDRWAPKQASSGAKPGPRVPRQRPLDLRHRHRTRLASNWKWTWMRYERCPFAEQSCQRGWRHSTGIEPIRCPGLTGRMILNESWAGDRCCKVLPVLILVTPFKLFTFWCVSNLMKLFPANAWRLVPVWGLAGEGPTEGYKSEGEAQPHPPQSQALSLFCSPTKSQCSPNASLASSSFSSPSVS